MHSVWCSCCGVALPGVLLGLACFLCLLTGPLLAFWCFFFCWVPCFLFGCFLQLKSVASKSTQKHRHPSSTAAHRDDRSKWSTTCSLIPQKLGSLSGNCSESELRGSTTAWVRLRARSAKNLRVWRRLTMRETGVSLNGTESPAGESERIKGQHFTTLQKTTKGPTRRRRSPVVMEESHCCGRPGAAVTPKMMLPEISTEETERSNDCKEFQGPRRRAHEELQTAGHVCQNS